MVDPKKSSGVKFASEVAKPFNEDDKERSGNPEKLHSASILKMR